MAKNDVPRSVKCSFCGKSQDSVKKIVAGPGVYICDECVDLCTSIIAAEVYEEEEEGYVPKENEESDDSLSMDVESEDEPIAGICLFSL